jgi:hypothetical protein
MNLCKRPPYRKPEKTAPDPEYLARVRQLPCCACGVRGVEAHHCRDLPDFGERGLYQRLPGAGQKSGDRDAIPLCPPCHRKFHLNRAQFHADHGRDYAFIGPTRAAINEGEIGF